MSSVAVIILNWNGQTLMEHYLPSVLAHTRGDGIEVVVADNGSTDGSVDWLQTQYPGLRLVLLDRNYGFAEGYNRAVEAVEAEYVVLLNSDIEVAEGWLEPLVGYMDSHPEVAACQPKILSDRNREYFEHAGAAGGFIDRLGYPFCRGRIQSLVEKDRGQYDSVADIFWATGACLMIRREDYLQAGGLDADFFAHMEEIDLCWRLRLAGRRLVCLPESQVFHLGGGTLNAQNPRKTFLNFRNNLLMLYKNLPSERLRSVMWQRWVLDMVAAVFFLFKGETKNFAAVFKARCAYRQMKPLMQPKRAEIQARACQHCIPEIYPGISTLDFFLRGKKTFDSLSFK
ncbi:MAG: glycosyltransferase family 2 protein [Bacteroidales bacterium]|nr:glycosyltransferase family 2 protein [Bacteroidales bacterium]